MTVIHRSEAGGLELVSFQRLTGERLTGERLTGERLAGERLTGERLAGSAALAPFAALELDAPMLDPEGAAAPLLEVADVDPAPPTDPIVVEIPEALALSIYERSVLRGLDAGQAQARAEVEVLRERYLAALEQMGAVSRQLVDRNRAQIIRLACRVAERLIRQRLRVEPEVLLDQVEAAITELEAVEEVVVRCSPDDHRFLVERAPDLAQALGESLRLRVRSDAALQPGDFQIESDSAHFDGRIAPQIERVEHALQEGEG